MRYLYVIMAWLSLLSLSCSKSDGPQEPAAPPKPEAPPKLISILTDSTSITLKPGQSFLIGYKLNPATTADTSLIWSSSDETIASISNRSIYAKKVGSCEIKAVSKLGGVSAIIKVTVGAIEVSSVSIYTQSIEIAIGETHQLTWTILPENATDKNVTFNSQNNAVATISNTGIVQAISIGETRIFVTANNNKTAECIIKVKPILVANITLALLNNIMEVGNSRQMSAVISPSNATNKNISWTSSDNSVATVTQTGIVDAKNLGSATIFVRSDDGNYQTSININVVDIDYFIKTNNSFVVSSYNSQSGLFTGTMGSVIINNSTNEIDIISFDIMEASTQRSVFKILNPGRLAAGRQMSTIQLNLSNVHKPYSLWTYSYNGRIYTREFRNFY